MKVKPCSEKSHRGVSGTVGAGHVHSHSGFVQDDSAGFAGRPHCSWHGFPCKRRYGVSGNGIPWKLPPGRGTGRAFARRGFTPFEAELQQRAVGLDGLFSSGPRFSLHGSASTGQGVLEAPVACNGGMHSCYQYVARNHPGWDLVSAEGMMSM